MNMTNDEIRLMESSASSEEWNANCRTIKDARDGQYPPDWWTVMKLSGRMDRILGKFGAMSDIRIG